MCLSPEESTSGRAYYENLCMRAVNQCIGRSIRHRNDYAGILLVDHRYGKENIRKQLPGWLQPQYGPVGVGSE
jgi:chromosome transmission fidelity protein 1